MISASVLALRFSNGDTAEWGRGGGRGRGSDTWVQGGGREKEKETRGQGTNRKAGGERERKKGREREKKREGVADTRGETKQQR